MKLVICDDDLKDAHRANDIIRRMPGTQAFDIQMRTPQDVYIAVEEDLFKCDILVVDIQYEGETYDGIQLTNLVNEKLPACQIIYLSNIIDFAPQVYETKHCYFVVKENVEIMLPRAVEKAIEGCKSIKNDIIEFLSNGHKVFLSQNEIVYIERSSRVLNIHTTKKTYQCYTSLRRIESKLGNSFARCHGGFIVNLSYVSSIDGSDLQLKDGSRLPIGMRFYEEFKLSYLKYYSLKM